MTNTELIAEAKAHIENTIYGLPDGEVAATIRRGEGADQRISLVVRLAEALESAEATIEEIRGASVEELGWVDYGTEVDRILAAYPTKGGNR